MSIFIDRPEPMPRYYVYALLCEDESGSGYIKFGCSNRISRRVSQIRSQCPIPVKYLALVEAASKAHAKNAERALHFRFKARKSTGEWFKFDFNNKEDKSHFNRGSKEVFATVKLGTQFAWWSKISLAKLDAYLKEIADDPKEQKGHIRRRMAIKKLRKKA